jgi:ABC-type nickel/cobalt efflux system permease component RcnA
MILVSQYTFRFFQWSFLLILLGLGTTLYTYWHQTITLVVEWQKVFHDLLATHINSISQDPIHHGLMLIALSFAYGVFHAIGPGHGKAIIIVYLSSHKESLRRGAMISLFAALVQALIAIFLVAILSKIFSVKFSKVSTYADDITLASYLLVMALGAFLFLVALSKQWKHIRQKFNKHPSDNEEHVQHKHNHSHDTHQHKNEDHHSCCGGRHAHQSDPKESLLQSMSVILSMGLRPCAGAIVVLIYAHLVGVFYYGVIATLVMGLGTGISVASMALGTQLARNWFEKFAKSNDSQSLIRLNIGVWLRMIGGLIIFLLGLSLFQEVIKMSSGHPLL